MGLISLHDMLDHVDDDIDRALTWHLRSNHYPPVPLVMLEPCKQAIDAMLEDEPDRQIELPHGVTYKGRTVASASAIVDQHHLHPFIEQEYDDYD